MDGWMDFNASVELFVTMLFFVLLMVLDVTCSILILAWFQH